MLESRMRQIFLSTTTSEFGSHRRMLKADLSLPWVKVQEQADMVQGGGKLLQTRYLHPRPLRRRDPLDRL